MQRRQAEVDGPVLSKYKAELAGKLALAAAVRRGVIVRSLRLAWGFEDEELRERGALTRRYLVLASAAHRMAHAPWFQYFMTATICLAGVVVGISTDKSIPGARFQSPVLAAIDNLILAVFTLEIAVKMVALGLHPLWFFLDRWNCFDFVIVATCFVFKAPQLENRGNLVAMLRLLRLFRVLKLLRAFPELSIIVEALTAGVASISFVLIILFIFYYVYANIGMLLFQVRIF